MRYAVIPTLSLAVLLAPACFAQDVEETRHHRLPAVADVPLKVMTKNGDIEIIRRDTKEIVITAVARAKTKERLAEIKFSATSAAGVGSEIHVDFPVPEKDQAEKCSLRIEMPLANGITAETTNGGITCYGMAGKAQFQTTNGPIAVEKQAGAIEAKTSNGPITVKLASAPAKLRTSNAPVTFTMLASASALFDIETSNGSVNVIASPAFSGVIDMVTSNGKLKFPATAVVQKPDTSKGQGWGNAAAVIAIGAGSGASVIKTSNGTIEISVGLTTDEDAAATPPPAQPAAPHPGR